VKLGINTYTYMWSIGFGDVKPEKPLSALGLLGKARELGISVVQVGPNLPLDQLPTAELEQFVQQARDWNIELELGTRGLEFDHLTRQVELAKHIGSSLLRTIPEVAGETPDVRDIPRYVRDILPLLQSEKVKLGLENGKIPAEDLRWIIEELASPYVGIVLDTVNSLAVPEGWKQVTTVLAPYTLCLHLKDFISQRVWYMMGFTMEGRPAGQGQLDVPWLLDTVKTAAKADFNVILELWPPEQKKLQETIDLEQAWAVESIHYLRAHIRD
jgi:sugar phosphate isomerase/epimerase